MPRHKKLTRAEKKAAGTKAPAETKYAKKQRLLNRRAKSDDAPESNE